MDNEKILKRSELKDDEIEEINGGNWTNPAEADRALAKVCEICERYGSYSREASNAKNAFNILNNDQSQHTFEHFQKLMRTFGTPI